ncbi:desulfoferrodoxin family protein [Anaerosacchariphilus polymeriproducens]|uniref:Desulfoferrodoxin n=1 Tax=Anaerosacchariphilus polymeriproducens TaxID=1812858 RepID=A0A371AVB0_9FIRM|nr:desulfoferrodoxin family protein [Anaerosacchariphilus polymeriproducens]RDU23507.1 desulfoferrodoxin [Anaerosacchariphilus polymeriproducens]
MKEQKFYLCRHCGNLVSVIHDSNVPIICCGEPMQELKANVVEASTEKHIPVVTVDDSKVTVVVGEVEHPMLNEHYIQWIYLQTEKGGQRKDLNPGDEPKAEFCLADDKPVAVYAYCNIHGLWKNEVE